MARFNKYAVNDLASFALEAPAIYKAVADEEIWQKYFKRKKSTNARGINLIKDGKIKTVYDVSETESTVENEIEVKPWQYDESAHKKLIDAVVAAEKDTEKQIRLIAQELTSRRNISEESKKLVSLSAEAVILERIGLPTENATRQLAKLSFKEQDIIEVLEETQATARIFLDALQKSIAQKEIENVEVAENNPLLKEIGTIKIEAAVTKTPETKTEAKKTAVQQELFADYTAEENTRTASGEIVQVMYEGLKNMGFKAGMILEPSMGVGGFFGNMPEEMKNASHLYGVELDSITGRIAKAIYPDAEISVKGFEDTRYLKDSFDIAVRNVPFGNYYVNDTGYNKFRFLIHDYFIAKMIDQVRPGGLVAVITSKGTLDKQDKRARKYFAKRADLVKAVRLPNNAFKNAGTDVTSDILFFKKLDNVHSEEELPNWVEVTPFQDEKDISINPYFLEHPENVLGTLEKTSTAYDFDLTCKPDENRPLNEMLSEVMQTMPQIYSPSATALPLSQQVLDVDDKRPSSYFTENGEIKFYDGVRVETIGRKCC